MIHRGQRYLRCPACLTITSGFSPDLSNHSIPCPSCNDKGRSRDLWPRFDILSVIDDSNLSQMDPEDSLPLKAILYCSVFDFLLEEFLSEKLHAIKTPPQVLEICMKGYSNFPERLDLFRQLIGNKFKDVLISQGFADFGKKFRILRDRLNYFVHQTFEHDFDNIEDIFAVVERDMLGVFVMLNNALLVTQAPSTQPKI